MRFAISSDQMKDASSNFLIVLPRLCSDLFFSLSWVSGSFALREWGVLRVLCDFESILLPVAPDPACSGFEITNLISFDVVPQFFSRYPYTRCCNMS